MLQLGYIYTGRRDGGTVEYGPHNIQAMCELYSGYIEDRFRLYLGLYTGEECTGL